MVRALAHAKKVRAIYQDRPMGKGNAVKTGFRAAKGDIFLIQDADLEYKVSEYPKLIAPILTGRANFVLGSRHLGHGSWKIRRFTKNRLKSAFFNAAVLGCHTLFNILHGTRLSDPTTMFKVFRRECIEGVVFRSNHFQMDWEIVAKILRRGHPPVEVPVSYVSRSVAEGKKVRFWRDGPLSLYAIVRFRFFD